MWKQGPPQHSYKMWSVKQILTKFCLSETIYLGIFLIPVFTHNTFSANIAKAAIFS